MYNRITLIGRLGRDAESRGKENQVATLNIATTNYYKKKDGTPVEEVEWTNCVAFGALGQKLLTTAKKGDLVMCEGSKRTQVYEKDGQPRMNVYVSIDTFRKLSWKKVEENQEPGTTSTPQE
jgi:single-strand DNA-binding protein